MSILSGRLGTGAGLGGSPGGGPVQSYGTPMAPATSSGSGIFADFKNASSDVRQGRISIAVLEALLILVVLFYIWTHNVQGGG
jgi:hypothetical protein